MQHNPQLSSHLQNASSQLQHLQVESLLRQESDDPLKEIAAFGHSPGNFVIHCIDCPKNLPEHRRSMGSISSFRCLFHALQARRKDQTAKGVFVVNTLEHCLMSFSKPRIKPHQERQLVLAGIVLFWGIIIGAAWYATPDAGPDNRFQNHREIPTSD